MRWAWGMAGTGSGVDGHYIHPLSASLAAGTGSGECTGTLTGHTGTVYALRPTDAALLSAAADGSVRLRCPRSFRLRHRLCRLRLHAGDVRLGKEMELYHLGVCWGVLPSALSSSGCASRSIWSASVGLEQGCCCRSRPSAAAECSTWRSGACKLAAASAVAKEGCGEASEGVGWGEEGGGEWMAARLLVGRARGALTAGPEVWLHSIEYGPCLVSGGAV